VWVRRALRLLLAGATAGVLPACAPVVPQRSKPGGAARWAAALSWQAAAIWAPDAAPCRVSGAGIGEDGWLPDKGGYWQIDYWSASKQPLLEVTVDADGRLRSEEIAQSPARGHTLPADWSDSPKAWAATRSHQRSEPLSTLEAELGYDAEPQRYPGRVVWRVRFWLNSGDYDTHVVTPQAAWLTSY